MLLLTMTKSMVEGLQKIESQVITARQDEADFDNSNELHQVSEEDAPALGRMSVDENEGRRRNTNNDHSSPPRSPNDVYSSSGRSEPSLVNPCLGNPISHGQVIDLSMQLREGGFEPYRLEDLLRGSNVYIAPPPPKSEPVSCTWSANATCWNSDPFSTEKNGMFKLIPA
jgi:hypothetical protein